MERMLVVVTGGSGKLGRAVVGNLVEYGYDVFSVDLRLPRERTARAQIVDVRDFGQSLECVAGADALVHLAGVSAPGLTTEWETFRTNVTSTFAVFEAARMLELKRVVWASSEAIFGIPFEREQPAYVPIDEEHPSYPGSTYALSKLLGETMAMQFARRTGVPFIALRFSYIVEPQEYACFSELWDDLSARRGNLWGYVDVRDAAEACRLALEAELIGAEVFGIAAADTVMNRPTRELLAEVFPDVPVRGGLDEFASLLSTAKAKRLIGYEPRFGWRTSTRALARPARSA
jgi:nucleoside-diphosphate-sugar epimerase